MQKTVIPLPEIASDTETRRRFIDDLCTLIDQEVSGLRGVKGSIVKKAYETIKSVRQGYIEHLIATMADDFVRAYEVLHADYRAGLVLPSAVIPSFVCHLNKHQEAYYESFLTVSNSYAKHHAGAMVSLAYKTLRPHMKSFVIESIPAVGALIDSYTIQEIV